MRGLAAHARDAGLPARLGEKRLFVPDEAEVLELVCRHLLRADAPAPLAAHWEFARYKPGHSLCLGYALDFPDGGREWVARKQYASSKPELLSQRAPRSAEVPPGSPFARLGAQVGADSWLAAYPFDRRLPGLARAGDVQRAARALAPEAAAAGLRLRWRRSRAELVRYKPERRAVLRLDLVARDEGAQLVRWPVGLRVLEPGPAARCLRARRALAFEAAPRLLGGHAARGLLWEEWLELDPGAVGALEAGELLGRLHASARPVGLPACPAPPEPADLRALFERDPRLARLAEGQFLDEPTGARVPSHGDFHADQLARSARGVVLLDLDNLGSASELADLAAWIADERMLRPARGFEEASAELLQGYERRRRAPERSALRRATALELVRRAAAALRRLELGAVERASELLELARNDLRAGAGPGLARFEGTLAALRQELGPDACEGIERVDLEEDGRPTVTHAAGARRRWFLASDGALEPLELARDERLPGATAAAVELERGQARLLSWRPGRRFVLQRPASIVKGVRATRLESVSRRQEEVARAAGETAFGIASILARDERLATIELEHLPGRHLDYARDLALAPHLARALREFQALSLPALEARPAGTVLDELDRLARRQLLCCGDLPGGWSRARAGLRLPGLASGAGVLLHADLYEAQILVSPAGLGLLDFDLVCSGESERDVANLLAHAELAGLRGTVDPEAVERFQRSFLEAWRTTGACRDELLEFHLRACRLRLALVWRLRAGGERLAARLVAHAAEAVDA